MRKQHHVRSLPVWMDVVCVCTMYIVHDSLIRLLLLLLLLPLPFTVFFSCSIFLSRCLPLSVVLNAFTNHIHSHLSKAKSYNSACAENVEAISVLSGCVFFLFKTIFLAIFHFMWPFSSAIAFFRRDVIWLLLPLPRRSHRRRRQFYLYQSQIFIVFVCIVTSFGFLSCHTSQRDKEKGLVAIATAVNTVNTLSIAIHLRDGHIFPNTASTGVIISIGLCVNWFWPQNTQILTYLVMKFLRFSSILREFCACFS